MNLAVTPFAVEHFGMFQPNESDLTLNDVEMADPARFYFSLTLDGVVHAMAGVQERWPKVGEAWIQFDAEVAEHHKYSFAKLLKKELMPKVDAYFRRISAGVDVENERAQRLVEWLGFHKEFPEPMCRFGMFGQGDYYQYVRFPGGC